jgi:CBS domain containing-hemolysin-like protein
MPPYLQLGLTLLLVALTGFFVAAEYAMIRVRPTRIDELAEQGNAPARTVQKILKSLDTFLSATQLGVTISTLGLSLVGEPIMERLLHPLFALFHYRNEGTIHTVSYVIGFIIITFLEVVFGELLPKWTVIEHAEKAAFFVAYPMNFFVRVFYPLVWVLEKSAGGVAKLLGLHPDDVGAHEQAHSEDEILAIMSHSQGQGELRPSELAIAHKLFSFAHTQAKEIMVPRVDMTCLSTTWTIGRNVEVAIENGFTRYPLCEGDRDHILGMVHIKDLLAIAGNPQADILSIKREILAIPETKPIDDLLTELQKSHSHQAVVVDEYGGTSGLVTLEDIIEELIGEIQDEHDEPPPMQQLDTEGSRFSVAGTVALEDVSETLGVPIDNPEDYDTIGGYALHQLRLAPRAGASARLDGFDVAVSDATGRRIRRLLFTRHTHPASLPQGEGSVT